jgi:hypothetical protein
MDKREARSILEHALQAYRRKPYNTLVSMIDGKPEVLEVAGATGAWYQIEMQCFWDDKARENVRVVGSIDDGGLRAFLPLSGDFIKTASEELIGE